MDELFEKIDKIKHEYKNNKRLLDLGKLSTKQFDIKNANLIEELVEILRVAHLRE